MGMQNKSPFFPLASVNTCELDNPGPNAYGALGRLKSLDEDFVLFLFNTIYCENRFLFV